MRIKIPYEPPSIPFSIPFWFNKDVAINSKKKKKKQNIISPTEYTPDLYSTIGGIQAPKGFKTNPVKGFTGIEQRPLIAKKKKKLFF